MKYYVYVHLKTIAIKYYLNQGTAIKRYKSTNGMGFMTASYALLTVQFIPW
jgi:hypothetical protein